MRLPGPLAPGIPTPGIPAPGAGFVAIGLEPLGGLIAPMPGRVWNEGRVIGPAIEGEAGEGPVGLPAALGSEGRARFGRPTSALGLWNDGRCMAPGIPPGPPGAGLFMACGNPPPVPCGRARPAEGRVCGICGRAMLAGICGLGDGIGRAIGICGRFMAGAGRAIAGGAGRFIGIAGLAPPAPT